MKFAVVGLGLIGASFARRLKENHNNVVYGYDISDEVMLKANLIGAIDSEITEENIKEVDMLIISLYPRLLKQTALKYLKSLKDGAIVVDFSGVKRHVVDDMKELAKEYPNLKFVAVHTMAGREYSGIDKSLTHLFDDASCIITNVNADIFTVDELKHFFLSLGFGEVVYSTAENHDEMIAYTSQLCHIVSNAFIKSPTTQKHFGYSAGSYKDLTRVARLNSTMWSELMNDNRDYLKDELDFLIKSLTEYKNALSKGDEKELKALLEEGNQLKIAIDKDNEK